MSQLNPSTTTAQDLCQAGLEDAGVVGIGQVAIPEYLTRALARLQWLLQQWERKRWFVWHLVDMSIVATGAQTYSIGPGGDIDTNRDWSPFAPAFNNQFGPTNAVSVRPDKIESSFLRQLTQSQPNQIDYPMKIIEAREDYNRIALKQLQSFPGYLFYDSAWPLGFLYPWPVPQASIYELHVSVKEQLPPMWATSGTVVDMPLEYNRAIVKNLAMELRTSFQIPTFPGDMLPGQAKDSLRVLRGANTQIGTLVMPGDLVRPQLYNIFSDRNY